MRLTSPAFEDGEHIPEKHGYTRENASPPLRFHDVPEAESLVLLMDDPDAKEPAGKIWDHWTVWNIDPSRTGIEEAESPEEAVEGMTDFRETGYGGPNPPDGTHTYRFRLYALDTELDLDRESEKEEVQEAMEDHVIEEAELEGCFSPL